MELSKNINVKAKEVIYNSIKKLLDRYMKEGISVYDMKRYFKMKDSFDNLLKDINFAGRRYFDEKEQYIKIVKKILNNIIMEKISNIETKKLNENKIIKYNDFLNEKIDVNNFDIDIEQLFNDIGYSNEDKDILSKYFNTRQEYIEVKNDKYCVYSVTDFKTDITNNNRTTMDVLLLANYQLEKIKSNIISKIINTVYNKIPNDIEYAGILIKTHTLLNKTKLIDSIKKLINDEDLINIISKTTNYNFLEKYGDFYIWKKDK